MKRRSARGNPHQWTAEFKAEITELFNKAVDLEYRYAEASMPRGVLGLNALMFSALSATVVAIGLEQLFPAEESPFPWMSEMIDLKKERLP